MLIPPEESGLKEARDADNNVTISDSTLQNILPPQHINMTSRYKVMCDCECCLYSKIMHSLLLSRRDNCLKLKDKSLNALNIRSIEMVNNLFETYKHYIMPHRKHMSETEYDTDLAEICAYTSSK